MTHVRIETDASRALEHLDQAVRLLRAGYTFDLALRLDDDRGSVAAILAERICKSHENVDARRAELERLGSADAMIGDNPLIGYAAMDLPTKATVRDLALLARTLVFRSWAEMRRAVMNFDVVPASYAIEPPNDKTVPAPQPRRDDDGSVLIWAPNEPIERLYIPLTAAAETGRAVRVVCKGGDFANISAQLVALEDADAALSRAAICVAASLSDPGPAIAVARWGIPLCATFTSGAYEWIDGVSSYRSWSVRSASYAFNSVCATPPPRVAGIPRSYPSVPEASTCDALVTIVVRTHGDSISHATAQSIARAHRGAFEMIAAPDANALRGAVAGARGAYLLFLQDGDVLFRDGLAELVAALERSSADVAYGDALLAYLVDAPGVPTVLGYSVLERMPVRLRSMSASDEFVGTYFRVLFKRELLVEVGLSQELDELVVYDAFLRVLARTMPIHVAMICGMSYRYLDGRRPGKATVPLAPEYRRIYARLSAEDAAVSAARTAVLEHLESHEHVALRPPPQRLNPPRPM